MALKDEKNYSIILLVYAILSESKKNHTHGYMIESKCRMMDGFDDFSADIIHNEEKFMIFQCKITTKDFVLGRTQLKTNMVNGGYPHGILICGEKTEIYTLDISKDDSVPVFENEYDNTTQLHELIQFIRDL
ncbi:hypothetical protein BB560_004204 [Smittium megazygosporum]|uniref:Uncharacterized protein n=1 Tax=Smittium megazygosporum TaxID=133381 RepID=A0A2T9ZA18_9FUNG|nr:hypothetical protein BB560_004204 [Smittium megazygosporum]